MTIKCNNYIKDARSYENKIERMKELQKIKVLNDQ